MFERFMQIILARYGVLKKSIVFLSFSFFLFLLMKRGGTVDRAE